MFQYKPNHFLPTEIRCADRKSDKEILHKMLASWAQDFNNSPWPCRAGNTDFDAAIKHAKEILIAEKNGEPAGLLLLDDFHKGAVIEIAYTADKYRHAGIATDLYTHAIQHMDAKFIVVPYAVVEKDIDYWKQLGFRSCGIHGHKDSGVDVDLVRLSTLPQKPFTPEQHELTLAEIKKLQHILKSGCYAVNYV